MFTQLARVARSLATLYPFGVQIEMVPDDKRGGEANLWPKEYGQRYIGGMQKLVRNLGFKDWLKIENGQDRLYKQYQVATFRAAAAEQLQNWQRSDPHAYEAKLQTAAARARENMAGGTATEQEARESALRYLIALGAEKMSGIFAPGLGKQDAFPLRYANHPGSYQLYTMGPGQTKLPWQIALPQALLNLPPAKPEAAHLAKATASRPNPSSAGHRIQTVHTIST